MATALQNNIRECLLCLYQITTYIYFNFKNHYFTWETCSTAFTFTLNDLQIKKDKQSWLQHNKYNKMCSALWDVLQLPSYHERILCFFLLVKEVRCDLQKWLEAGKGSIIHQQINGANILQGGLCSPPVCQVYTHWGDGCTLGERTKTTRQCRS